MLRLSLGSRYFSRNSTGSACEPAADRLDVGDVIQTISRTVMEELDRSAVTSLDWESYPILRFLAGRSDRRPAPGFAERAPVGAPGSPPLRSCPPRSRTLYRLEESSVREGMGSRRSAETRTWFLPPAA